jgi:hypothetical protein
MPSSTTDRYIIDVRISGPDLCKRIIVEMDDNGKVAIVNRKSFHTLSSLIAYYRKNSLERYFPHIPTHLVHPLGGKGYCLKLVKAEFEFTATKPDELSVKADDELEVLKERGEWFVCRTYRGEGLVPSNHTTPM